LGEGLAHVNCGVNAKKFLKPGVTLDQVVDASVSSGGCPEHGDPVIKGFYDFHVQYVRRFITFFAGAVFR
jgi:hypothetical protein